MTGLELWLIAFGLAMDCFAVSIAGGIVLKGVRIRPMLVMAFFFGLFQAGMPLIGWSGASLFSHLIEEIDHWVAFGILSILGGNLIKESFKDIDQNDISAIQKKALDLFFLNNKEMEKKYTS